MNKRFWLDMILLAIAIVLSVGTLLLAQDVRNHQQHDAHLLRRVDLTQCQRVQHLRTDFNLHVAADYRVLITALQLQTALTPRDQKLVAPIMRKLHHEANEFRFLPPVDCRRAVADPFEYREPKPIPFTQLYPNPDP